MRRRRNSWQGQENSLAGLCPATNSRRHRLTPQSCPLQSFVEYVSSSAEITSVRSNCIRSRQLPRTAYLPRWTNFAGKNCHVRNQQPHRREYRRNNRFRSTPEPTTGRILWNRTALCGAFLRLANDPLNILLCMSILHFHCSENRREIWVCVFCCSGNPADWAALFGLRTRGWWHIRRNCNKSHVVPKMARDSCKP